MIPTAIAFLLGVSTAGAWVVYIHAVGAKQAPLAAVADLAILVMGSASVQLWSRQKAFRLFVAFDVGAALGTFCLVRWGVQ